MEKIPFDYVYHVHEGMEDIYFICSNTPKPFNTDTFKRLNLLANFKDFTLTLDFKKKEVTLQPIESNRVLKVERQKKINGKYIKGKVTRFKFNEIMPFSEICETAGFKGKLVYIFDHRDNTFMIYDKGATWNEFVWLNEQIKKRGR